MRVYIYCFKRRTGYIKYVNTHINIHILTHFLVNYFNDDIQNANETILETLKNE